MRMAEDDNMSSEQSMEHHIVTLISKLETLKGDQNVERKSKVPIKTEIRSLELWKSVICECIGSFIYVFIVCGASAGAVAGAAVPSVPLLLLSTALATGLTIVSLTQCFGQISGAHINPAVTIAMCVTKNISLLRAKLFIIAQCGGAIAGAAFLYGVTVPRNTEIPLLSVALTNTPWEEFGIEFILTFMVVFSYFGAMNTKSKLLGNAAINVGATYSACSFICPIPHMNPARSLGPSFVLSKWENHWVYWLGPIIGGIAAGVIHEYGFNAKRRKCQESVSDADSCSVHSDEDTYDDVDKATVPKYHGSTYNTYRPANPISGTPGYCPSLTSASLYSAPTTKLERVESLYGGTKSLYCKSPPLTRANLNRSQSVYTKSNSGVNKDVLPRPGPLVPAQSLYPMKLNQQTHVHNQNLQNQLQQRSDSMYGNRAGTISKPERGPFENYSATDRPTYKGKEAKFEEAVKGGKTTRPESIYGILGGRRGQSTQSDDSSYGSYHGSSARANYHSNTSHFQSKSNSTTRTGGEGRANVNQLATITGNSSSSYHHNSQHSPALQY